MQAKRGKIKVDGLWFNYIGRESWGKIYYSMNAGRSFHATKREAYYAAYEQGNLDLTYCSGQRIQNGGINHDSTTKAPASNRSQNFDLL